jgi:hypothetical protein
VYCLACASCLAGNGEHLRCQILEAFGCWLRLTEGAGLPQDLTSSPLVAAALEGLDTEPTFHAATDAVSRGDSGAEGWRGWSKLSSEGSG